ncbi:hypothetical protein EXE43_01435 [Halorubrum sp. SS5]|uniref:DUF7573 domain-containing protein n=1 Tax=Halorubrum salinarum TaxID=2739057 RepID=A0A7D3XVF8_9EURY|nr:hypothetical protein [Halorubrum salinarum]QKG92904.1 hypothetical protein HPS36_08560 [Halorubrum salinarum]TKX87749.1 hypothetical protein EXE43_01435 [Halorubrum sp. SS5]
MTEDRSLDDFAEAAAGDGDAARTGSDAEPDPVDPDGAKPDSGDLDGAADADPAVATSTWHADGAACDRCGERVHRRWREADAFVCADCASW